MPGPVYTAMAHRKVPKNFAPTGTGQSSRIYPMMPKTLAKMTNFASRLASVVAQVWHYCLPELAAEAGQR
jgi:hypothetical protein